jgi:hypothetical protein
MDAVIRRYFLRHPRAISARNHAFVFAHLRIRPSRIASDRAQTCNPLRFTRARLINFFRDYISGIISESIARVDLKSRLGDSRLRPDDRNVRLKGKEWPDGINVRSFPPPWRPLEPSKVSLNMLDRPAFTFSSFLSERRG